MGTIDAKKLNAALAKAKDVGLVEEACSIAGCELVIRSLRSQDYAAVLQDCDGLPEEDYIHRYQKGHIARAIVEVNGVNLRDSRLVTVEEPDPSTGTMRAVTLELHQYLTNNMLDSWGKEAVDVAFRKVGDVLELAERQAKNGISFLTPDETSEEKYRRLILEARAVEKELPGTLVDRILDEQGLMSKSTAEELKRAMSRSDQLTREQTAQAPEEKAEVPVVVVAADEKVTQEAPPAPPPARPVDPHATLQSAIASRKAAEVPTVKSEQAAEQRPAASRAAAIAAVEGNNAVPADLSSAVSLQSGDPREVVEIRRAPLDLQVAGTLLDNPPVAGINPRFRPMQRG